MAKRGLTIEEIYKLTAPSRGISGALSPNAGSNFKKLHLDITTGYTIAGLEPQNVDGSFTLIPGNWKYRGG